MAEKKRYPETAIEQEAMKEFEDFMNSAPDLRMLSGNLTELYQIDIPDNTDKLDVRIIVTGTFELYKRVDKRDPWWVD